MKALVFSDSHNTVWLMNELTEKYKSKTDCIIHLGDCTEDMEDIKHKYPRLPIYQVSGNNDYDSLFPSERVISLGGRRIYMTHGHRQRVYYNTDRLYYSAVQEQADIALFGHTHVPYLENEGGILIMNPGSISLPRSESGKTFAFITVENVKITLAIMAFRNGNVEKLRTMSI